MIVCHSHKFLFSHVPKTGGSSISKALVPTLGIPDPPYTENGWQFQCHDTPHMHSEWKESSELASQHPDYFWFAFVRNPWSRAISIWMHGRENEDQTLAEFFKAGNFRRPYMKPQVTFIRPDGPDFIGRFESIEADFKKACDRIGIACELPHINVFQPTRGTWQTYYDQESAELVRKTYEEDIEAFGYEDYAPC